jgi:hypothetical protein
VQSDKRADVVANSEAFSGLDNRRTNPRPACGRNEDEAPNSKSERDQNPGGGDDPLGAARSDLLTGNSCPGAAPQHGSPERRPPVVNPPETVREGCRKTARERGQRPERRDIERSKEEHRIRAQIDKLAGFGEYSECPGAPPAAAVGTPARANSRPPPAAARPSESGRNAGLRPT